MGIYSNNETKFFRKLNSPKKIQDYLNSFKFNFEKNGETCMSPRFVIKNKTAHCMEGAMFAAAALEFHGHKPLLMDLRAIKVGDFDHVVAVFKQFGCYGAISKTNHGVLCYREPIYKSIRELALSYFHEYFLDSGKKTLREYSELFDLRYFDQHPIYSNHPVPLRGTPLLEKEGRKQQNWRTSSEDLFEIPRQLDKIKHFKILSSKQVRNLRKADKIEIQAGKLIEWKKK